MNNFVLLVDFNVLPESVDRFNELIDINARASVADEPGCLQFDVNRSMDDPCRIVLYEVYKNEDAFKEHMTRAHTTTFLAAAKPLVIKQTAVRMTRMVAPPVKPD